MPQNPSINVGTIRKAIEGLPDEARVLLIVTGISSLMESVIDSQLSGPTVSGVERLVFIAQHAGAVQIQVDIDQEWYDPESEDNGDPGIGGGCASMHSDYPD